MYQPHRVLNVLDNEITKEAFAEAAAILGCEAIEIKVVFDVEAAGNAFDRSHRVVRRFEPHQFPDACWEEIGFNPGGKTPWRASLRLNTATREAMFEKALLIDMEAAYQATSWGAPQIMGFNHAAAGYGNAAEMVEAFARSANEQVAAFARLVKAWGLDGAIRAHDWRGFAAPYNGNGQADAYAAKLEGAWRRLTGEGSSVVLRTGARGESVTTLQNQLQTMGYKITAVDGQFGAETAAAVRAAQRDNGLTVDGVVGARTWETLRAKAPMKEPEVQKTSLEVRGANFVKTIAPAVGGVGAGSFFDNINISETVQIILASGLVIGIIGVGAYFLLPRLRDLR